MRKLKVDPNKKDIVKRFAMTKEEKAQMQSMQSVMTVLRFLKEGMNHSMLLELARVRKRLNIKEQDAPEGYERFVDIDDETFEILVKDIPIASEEKVPDPGEKPENKTVN